MLPSYNGSIILEDGTGNTSYYDDNEWVGIELVRLYELYREPSTLTTAERIMAFVMAGWTGSQPLVCQGGMPFSTFTDQERNTVTTAPASELGVLLYRLTHNAEYLQFAEIAYEWVRSCLSQPSGLYADHIGIHGKRHHHDLELQPGDDDRGGHVALPGHWATELSFPGSRDRSGGARTFHAGRPW